MKKFLRVFFHEYARHVFRRRFILLMLSMPLVVVLIAALSFLMVYLQFKNTPIGYVDLAGVITKAPQYPVSEGGISQPVQIISYLDENEARADVEKGVIQGVYIIQSDYMQTGNVTVVEKGSVSMNAADDFSAFLRNNLYSGLSPEVALRLYQGASIEVLSLDGSREASGRRVLDMILPIAVGLLMMIIVNISGGYLLQSVVEEKENRTMEMVITSVSPNQLMIGKILADICVGLTQLIFWLIFVGLGLAVASVLSPWVAGQMIDSSRIWLAAAVIPPAFLIIGGLMATVGVMFTENKEAQQVTGVFSIVLFVPLMMSSVLMMQPNSPIALFLTFFPLTSPITILLRSSFTSIPDWQLVTALIVLYASAWICLWLAGKAMKAGMLQYGRRITLKEVFQRGQP